MMKSPTGVRWLAQRLADLPRHNGWLTQDEFGVLASKKVAKRRADWRLGRWTAKRVLLTRFRECIPVLDFTDIEVRAAADGAPEAFIHNEAAPVALSLSHSHGVALCVIGAPDVGIGCDTEFIEPRSDAFVSDYFTEAERDRVSDTPLAQRPLVSTLIWSAKESVLKAVREGLRRDTRSVVVDIHPVASADEWTHFPARCSTTQQRFDGWWRASDEHVYTIARRP